jgi:hypothetical protein
MMTSTLQSVVGYAAVVAVAIPDAMMLPIEVRFVKEAQLSVPNSLACPKHAISDSNPGS